MDGVEVTRLAGSGRVQTAVEVARELAAVAGGVDEAIVVRSDDFADALAASNLAVPGQDPILLTGSAGLDANTAAVLDELVADGATVFLAGGTSALSDRVATDVADAGYDVRRLAGQSRYGTAVAITEETLGRPGVAFTSAVLASGRAFPDALAAGPAAARLGGLLVLVDPADLADSPETRDLLLANAGVVTRLFVAGGTSAISDDVVLQAVGALGG